MKHIPLFTPFKDIKQGMDTLIKTINKVKDDSTRTELAIIYGCLGSTLNQINDDCVDPTDEQSALIKG